MIASRLLRLVVVTTLPTLFGLGFTGGGPGSKLPDAKKTAPDEAAKPATEDGARPPRFQIRLREDRAENGKAIFEVSLGVADAANLARLNWEPEQWKALFAVYVDATATTNPAMLGSYHLDKNVIHFAPRFPLEPGVTYRAVFRPSKLPDHAAIEEEVAETFTRPKMRPAAVTVVQQVYPSGRVLPENHLRFYIRFSAPMSRGEAYKHLQLLDASGKPVPFPFLELDEELWDPQCRRFTLLFHPGRVKKGLKPREEMGPVLEEGKSYTLVVDKGWPDANGNPLKESFRKSFRAGPAQEQLVDPKTWKIEAPTAGTAKPVAVRFPKPLDHALLERLLWVTDVDGKKIEGTGTTTDEETCWRFTPANTWKPGTYRVVADTMLEDSTGNSIARQFEVDVFRPIPRSVTSDTVKLPFQVRTGDP
jgi:hypothetical protein